MRLYLAPLAEFTDAPFRRLCHEGGADVTYTEMVSAAALAHGHTGTRILMETMEGEGPVACQVFGAKVDEIAFAAAEISKLGNRFCEINLNAGCPMTKVTRCGAGAKLVESPDKIYELLKAIVANTSLPVTLKTRLGPNPARTTIFEILDAAERAGAAGLMVHARYTSQLHGGPIHLDTLADVVSRARIPIVGNGSVRDAKTAEEMAATGVSGIMIGRAALPNPAIFDEIKGIRQKNDFFERHLTYLLEFHRQLSEHFPSARLPSEDAFVVLKARTHLMRYFSGQPGAAAFRASINNIKTLSDLRRLVAERFASLQ